MTTADDKNWEMLYSVTRNTGLGTSAELINNLKANFYCEIRKLTP